MKDIRDKARNDAGVWLCEYPGPSFQRCPVRACSLVSSLLLNGATMSQESSLTQSAHSVRQVLTAYTGQILAEIAEDLVRGVLAKHLDEKTISLLAISVSNLEKQSVVQLELPLGLADEDRRPDTRKGAARWLADRAVDMIRDRFGWKTVGYGSVALGLTRSVPDEFRELAEKDL